MTSENVEPLLQRIKELEEEILDLKEKLKKYTKPQRNKDYYKRNAEKIREKDRERRAKQTPEQKEKMKEYNRRYYLQRKKKEDENQTRA